MKRKAYLQPVIKTLSLGSKEDIMQEIGFNTGSAKDPDPKTPHYSKDWSTQPGENTTSPSAANIWED